MWGVPVLLLLFASTPSRGEEPAVRLDLPESVPLHVMVDYVARTLNLNVLYDTTQLQQTVTLRAYGEVPHEQLLALLRRLLRSRQLALVPALGGAWYEIVTVERLPTTAPPIVAAAALERTDPNEVVVVTIPGPFPEESGIGLAIEAVLSKPGGRWNRTPAGDIQLMDFAGNVRAAVARLADLPTAGNLGAWTLIPVQHAALTQLAELVVAMTSSPAPGALPVPATSDGFVRVDPLGRGLLVRGSLEWTGRVQALVAEFDVAEQQLAVLYQPRFIDANRLQEFITGFPGAAIKAGIVDPLRNTYWLEAPPMLHARLREYLGHVDVAGELAARPLRIYKLLNRRADDMFATLGGLLGGRFADPAAADGSVDAASAAPLPSAAAGVPDARPGNERLRDRASPNGGRAASTSAGGVGAGAAIQGDGYSLALDEHTNSIIAIATPEIHAQLRQLIDSLDRRRPQVLVEVTLVSISLEDSLNLGVELSTLDLGDPWDYLLFTSFGLSSIDPATGARRLSIMPGGSGILLAPDEVPIIINALKTRGNTRVFSAPKILVDDNATGRIESVAESPFTSVNASDTVATTAFAGFAKAGTQLSIEPHIAEGDHLELQYDLTVSSFTGAGSATVPPPRSSDSISSTVRVPDGHTVVVGGLLSETLAEAVSRIPLIGDVPILGGLFGNQSRSKSKVRLYAFIRPSILRHADFADLKYLSQKDLEAAEVDDGFPPTQYQIMR